jgi:hypothetical protein
MTNSYEPPDDAGVECASMRSIEDHARYLGHVMEVLLRPKTSLLAVPVDAARREWDRARQWLMMVRGLRYVDIYASDGPYWLCSAADDWEGRRFDAVSDVATEETRLLYAWGALERLMRMLDLPSIADAKANGTHYNRASAMISAAGTDAVLDHYDCTRRHLQKHILGDPDLVEERGVKESMATKPWRADHALLLAMGASLRNIPAHGARDQPEPTNGSDSQVRRPMHSDAHAPRLATRGLLLSIQQLLALCSEVGDHSDFEAEEIGWWTRRAGDWILTPEPQVTDLLECGHLKPPPT